jgi:hypothetical protein
MHIDALLCDAVNVREGLLFVIGGGVTRLWRPTYPAELGVDLALMIWLDPSEAEQDIAFSVVVKGADTGVVIASAEGSFKSSRANTPGADLSVPLALDLRRVVIPAPGAYVAEIRAGTLVRPLHFVAAAEPPPDPPAS